MSAEETARAEEQAMEIEALQAIFGEEELVKHEGPAPAEWGGELGNDCTVWSLLLSPLEDGDRDRDRAPAQLRLLFAHPPGYPDERGPLLACRSEKARWREVRRLPLAAPLSRLMSQLVPLSLPR